MTNLQKNGILKTANLQKNGILKLVNLDFLFLSLQTIFHVDLYERQSLIIFDEVQFCPRARQAIKALVKDHRYDYIETGSLISIQKNVRDILSPSEEERIEMFPLDYEEFSLAVNGRDCSALRKFYEAGMALGPAYRNAMRDFRLYMLVGGMPQVVQEYLAYYKIYCGDTGLFTTLMFKDKSYTENIIYRQLLSDKLPANLGFLYENAVAQTFAAGGHKLYYHTWKDRQTGRAYEIDFLLAKGKKISPVEVKSSGYRNHKSIDAFADRFSSRVGEQYLIYTKDYAKDRALICLPIYMAQFLT
jgi:predicted AAA+ superfamily ATPase